MRKLRICLLLGLTFLVACKNPFNNSSNVMEIYVTGGENVRISKGAALQDYDMMWLLLEENFPFLDCINDERNGLNMDWQVIRDEGRHLLENYPGDSFTTKSFFEHIKLSLNPLQDIGHLSVISPDFRHFMIERYSEVLEDDILTEMFSDCAKLVISFYERIIEQLLMPHVKEFYNDLEFLTEFGNQVPLQSLSEVEDLNHLEEEIKTLLTPWVEDNVAYIRIPMMGLGHLAGDQFMIEMLQNFFYDNRKVDHMIIDIRGNAGGNDLIWQKGVLRPLIQQNKVHRYLTGMLAGELNQYFWNDYQPISLSDGTLFIPQEMEWQVYFETIPLSRVENLDYLFMVIETFEVQDDAVDFTGEVWLLVDEVNYSAAEAFAHFSKETGFATLVGRRTGGSGLGISPADPVVLVLPNSGLALRYDIAFGFNHDGTNNGIIGTLPDIEIEIGQDALEVVLEMIGFYRE